MKRMYNKFKVSQIAQVAWIHLAKIKNFQFNALEANYKLYFELSLQFVETFSTSLARGAEDGPATPR